MSFYDRLPSWAASLLLLASALCITVVFLPGCGGSDSAPAAKDDASGKSMSSKGKSTKTKSTGATAKVSTQSQSASQENSLIRTDQQGRKWIDDIPLDVFFNDPLAIANDTQQVATPSMAATGSPASATADAVPAGDASTAAPTSAVDWKSVISRELLDSEVKRLRNELTKNLQSVGTYNLAQLTIPVDSLVLAVLAEIALEHPDAVSWQDKSQYVRELALQMAAEASGRGRKAFDATKAPFEDILVILNGGNPAALPDAESQVPFSQFAERSELMVRLESSSKWLKSNAGNEGAFTDQADNVKREAAIIAALAQVILTPEYDSYDEAEYQTHANNMRSGGITMSKADNFAEYDMALTGVFKACTECHSSYRD